VVTIHPALGEKDPSGRKRKGKGRRYAVPRLSMSPNQEEKRARSSPFKGSIAKTLKQNASSIPPEKEKGEENLLCSPGTGTESQRIRRRKGRRKEWMTQRPPIFSLFSDVKERGEARTTLKWMTGGRKSSGLLSREGRGERKVSSTGGPRQTRKMLHLSSPSVWAGKKKGERETRLQKTPKKER